MKKVPYRRRYLVASVYGTTMFIKADTNSLWRAKRIARDRARYHPKVEIFDTRPDDEQESR